MTTTETKEIQTIVNFKNLDFTIAAEKVYEAKIENKTRVIIKLMQKVSHNLST